MTVVAAVQGTSVGEQILDLLDDVPSSEAIALLRLVVAYLEGTTMLTPPPRAYHQRKGCPSEAQYRRHLRAGEDCARCRRHMAAKRRAYAHRRAAETVREAP